MREATTYHDEGHNQSHLRKPVAIFQIDRRSAAQLSDMLERRSRFPHLRKGGVISLSFVAYVSVMSPAPRTTVISATQGQPIGRRCCGRLP